MKIHRIRCKNLNSLTGTFEIDFSDPSYADYGIFAITGPTGSGKSTILDALCLALYGRTPRLDKVTQSQNGIISQSTGDCSAEVEFSTIDGRYIAHWSQRRARLRPDGALQEPKHEVSDAKTGRIIDTRLSTVKKTIETITGMDFDRFTRTVVLAQGAFAAFLQASPDDRSPILEAITGTEIYSRISIAVHTRLQIEQDLLRQHQSSVSEVRLLTPEEEAILSSDIATHLDKISEGEKEALVLRNSIDRYRRHQQLVKDNELLCNDEKDIAVRMREFEPLRLKLKRSSIAVGIEPHYSRFTESLERQSGEQQMIDLLTSRLEHERSLVTDSGLALRVAETAAANLKTADTALSVIIREVRELDIRIHTAGLAYTSLCREVESEVLLLGDKSSALTILNEKLAQGDTLLQKIDVYLAEHPRDGELTREIGIIFEKLESMQNLTDDSRRLDAEMAAGNRAVTALEKRIGLEALRSTELGAGINRITAKRGDAEETLFRLLDGKLLREYHNEYEALLREDLLLDKIHDLETERTRLVSGEPCPLCGSTAHPFTKGNLPHNSEIKNRIAAISARISQIQLAEASISDALRELDGAREIVFRHEVVQSGLQHEFEREKSGLARLLQDKQRVDQEIVTLTSVVAEYAERYGIDTTAGLAPSKISSSLGDKRDNWNKCEKRKRDELEIRSGLLTGINSLQEIISHLEKTLAVKREKQHAAGAELTTLESRRVTLFGENNADDAEKQSALVLAKAVQDSVVLQTKLQAAENELTVTLRSLTDAQGRHHRLTNETTQNRVQLDGQCIASGFLSAFDFIAARLDESERIKLEELEHALDTRLMVTRSRILEMQQLLVECAEQLKSDEPYEICSAGLEHAEMSRKIMSEKIGALKHQLEENETARTKLSQNIRQLAAQQKDTEKWARLHALIGSSDGKKFRNFAQGITFEKVIACANRQLRRLTDRYLLTSDARQPLEFHVIDTYQAGECRSARNLSGGETFIVSLALALGLSKMSSSKIRVDSLFLDEGFGTLDEDSLESALETLSGLREEGKLIGIISHLPSLRERIATHITVIPQSGGRSTLNGPGCRQFF